MLKESHLKTAYPDRGGRHIVNLGSNRTGSNGILRLSPFEINRLVQPFSG